MTRGLILCCAAALAAFPAEAVGQTPAGPPQAAGRATFPLLGRAYLDDYSFALIGVEVLAFRQGAAASRFAFATAPAAVAEGVLLLDMEAGPAFVVPINNGLSLVPHGGLSLDVAGAGVLWGFQGGLGLLARLAPGMGLRFTVTRRWLRGERGWEPMTTWFVGLGSLPR